MEDADVFGHLVLVLATVACALVFRGIPAWLWFMVYVFSVFVSPMAWKEKALTPMRWLVGAICFAGLTALLYRIGVGLLGSAGVMIFKIPGIIVPALALTCLSGLARVLYERSHWTAGEKSDDKVNNTTAH